MPEAEPTPVVTGAVCTPTSDDKTLRPAVTIGGINDVHVLSVVPEQSHVGTRLVGTMLQGFRKRSR
jgi:hypothetical protein